MEVGQGQRDYNRSDNVFFYKVAQTDFPLADDKLSTTLNLKLKKNVLWTDKHMNFHIHLPYIFINLSARM